MAHDVPHSTSHRGHRLNWISESFHGAQWEWKEPPAITSRSGWTPHFRDLVPSQTICRSLGSIPTQALLRNPCHKVPTNFSRLSTAYLRHAGMWRLPH